MGDDYKVEMEYISKAFGGIYALTDVNLKIKKGEVHALIGENGAGKSTLMNILCGVYKKDHGIIKIDGKETEISNPYEAQKMGIGIVHQELALAPDLTVAENIFIGNLSDNKIWVSQKQLEMKASDILHKLGFDFSPKKRTGSLSVAYQQVVEIAKEMSKNAKVLILDEPTAVLSHREVEKLFAMIKELKNNGISIIYISHRLDEVLRISDRVTILKDGSYVDTIITKETDESQLIYKMIGRKLSTMFPVRDVKMGEELFRVDNLSRKGVFEKISFSVKAGEVLGLAGLVGSGRTEIVRAIFGADKKSTGAIYYKGQKLKISSPSDAVKYGIGLVPEDRKEQGVILSMPIASNITMASIQRVAYGFGVLNKRSENIIAKDLSQKLSLKAKSIASKVSSLSGGNQQKCVLAKWLSANCKVIIFDEPTRGVDVGAKVEIYKLINELAVKGLGIIVISSETLEILSISDRILVISEGIIAGSLENDEKTEENFLKFAIPMGRRTAEQSH